MNKKGKLRGWKEILRKSLIQRQMLKYKVKSDDKPQCRSCGSQLQNDAQRSGTAKRNSETDDTHTVDSTMNTLTQNKQRSEFHINTNYNLHRT